MDANIGLIQFLQQETPLKNNGKGVFMNRLKVVWMYLAVAIFVGFTVCSFNVLAEEKGPQQTADRKDLEKGLENTLGMPMLTGDVWEKMSPDAKVAFIWGFGHVVTIEQHLIHKYPELKRDSFVPRVVEGMAGIPMNDVVARVDKYYSENPDHLKDPVTKVMWDTMIKPNIKVGIAGRPLAKTP
ncbi:MAG: hypothetical protein HQK60_13670 [Deltaproteobacteria bacterium]|nr:hypothetical protein [Deltaproteobacteria bacterium]